MLKISLAAARVNAGMTQHQVAKKMGVSPSTIISWEKGKTVPGIPELTMMSLLYDIPLDNIFLPSESTLSREEETEAVDNATS